MTRVIRQDIAMPGVTGWGLSGRGCQTAVEIGATTTVLNRLLYTAAHSLPTTRRFLISSRPVYFKTDYNMWRSIILAFLLAAFGPAMAQNSIHPASTAYVYPSQPEVAQNLEHWRDQKFGIIIHWGLYAVPGIIESWSLCNEAWIRRDTNSRYDDYKKWYWGLHQQFNPQKFNPDSWAQAAKAAGMRYLVFTTKHHDGFNMFDTRASDFKITNGPFKDHPKANVAYHVFDAFRRAGFLIGAYFSKPDWHSQDFWWDLYATPDRNVNYDIREYPWRWQRFVQFTHQQLHELTSQYGKVDILWLDGGWVRPRNTVTEEVLSWGAPIPPFDQSIDMPAVAALVRKNQPGMLIVDRTQPAAGRGPRCTWRAAAGTSSPPARNWPLAAAVWRGHLQHPHNQSLAVGPGVLYPGQRKIHVCHPAVFGGAAHGRQHQLAGQCAQKRHAHHAGRYQHPTTVEHSSRPHHRDPATGRAAAIPARTCAGAAV